METTQNVPELKAERVQQELKAERVQEEALAVMRKRILEKADAVGAALGMTQTQVERRLKVERVQVRLAQMPGWTLLAEGAAIDRVRNFQDPLVAAAYLAFASLLARQTGQPLQISVTGGIIVMALTGRTKGTGKGITDAVLDLAGQLG
jgi:pterin-4a-carbinolamine dehydratase